MSNRDEYIGLRENSENQSFSFSNTKNRSHTNTAKNSSSKKKGKPNKIFIDKKQIEINEKAQIKTPQSQSSRMRKGLAGDRFIPVRTNEENNSNMKYMLLQNYPRDTHLNPQIIINNITNTSTNNVGENVTAQTNQNNTNNYHNLMMDSLLLRSNSESFSVDRNHIKNMNSINEGHRDRVLSFNSNNVINGLNNPQTFLNQIKQIAENKSLTESFTSNNKFASLSRLKEINHTPERILDAPSLIDDYYLNLIDWSSQNVLAVSLGNSVYLWNGCTSETLQLMSNTDNICSVNWINSGNCLAIGLKNGHIELWDTNKLQQIRNMEGHSDRVCSLSWNNSLLSSGSKDTKIINHDVRVRNHIVHNLVGHTQEVCSLQWSPDGSLLASGGNDNLLCIWDVNLAGSNNSGIRNRSSSLNNFASQNYNNFGMTNNYSESVFNFNNNNRLPVTSLNGNNNFGSRGSNNISNQNSIWSIIEEGDLNTNNLNSSNLNSNNNNLPAVNQISPKFTFTQHEAAVKALAWCPWQKGLLASGAGSKDKTIKFWNIDTASLINSVDSGSQVCSLLWDKHEKELISSHGYSKHQISIWKYPSMCKVTELSGHMSRVLYMAMSPDGCSIVSGAGDETLRFWKIHDNKKTSNESIDFKILNSFQLR